ncbi:D-alanyl-D-alanine-carboxypeptidase/endopeptidase AmpH [Oxalobacteraceae bacterium CAVE-383]|nr:D-alanyl-D-alanine-carboxypeptidase/endopeptidase AmpH [Oxalobacteraceae bacterium CAVE-383]
MKISVIAGLTSVLLVLCHSAYAQSASLEQTLALASEKMFAASGASGMVTAVVRGDTLLIQSYGETEQGNGQRPNANSLLRVGSMSKVLASELMVKLAKEGRLKLTDPLQKYAPHGAQVPQISRYTPITLLSLATHTSGLPRSASGKAPEHAAPFTWPDHAARWHWLHRQMPILVPGTHARYSNVAYDLLADAISTAGGKPYAQLLREKITIPLGMHDTTLTPTAEQCGRLMVGAGIDPAGPCTDTRATGGSGGVYSTANDMGLWMQHLLGISQAAPAAQRAVCQAIYVQRQELASIEGLDLAGRASGLGLGWVLLAATDHSPAILQKTGGGGGFMSYMALVPGHKLGVFVAISKVDMEMFSRMTQAVNALLVSLD